ncbi:MAG: cyclic nucleotide-binding domain-containing protein [Anaerolineae bacterium]|nr:cyclic nucleotide-binding domain-containing protein [Anaerolineae bacterium]
MAEAWEVLKDTALVKAWPNFKSDCLPRLDRIAYPAGAPVTRYGDPPGDCFIVGAGEAHGHLYRNAHPWFGWRMKPGDCFGQAALYFKVPQIEVQAVQPTVLYRLRSFDLRSAIERNEKLYELLLRQSLASRLRRLPLLRTLDDATIRQIAPLIEEIELPAEREVDLAAAGSLYVIEWGQVEVTGPAALDQTDWRLTAGNFFVAPAGPSRLGQNCVATSARTRYATRLFRFSAALFNALASEFPDVERLVRHPLQITDLLNDVPALRGLSPEQRLHLAQFCGWMFVPAGQDITVQGQPGYGLVILRQGEVMRSALDEQGRRRPRDTVRAPDYYGETSLFKGGEREATVRAVSSAETPEHPRLNGADIIVLDRRDMYVAFAEDPQLWAAQAALVQRVSQSQQEARPFPWMEDSEKLIWKTRPHWLWVVGPEAVIGIVFAALWIVAALVPPHLREEFALFALLVSAFALLPAAAFILLNYLDDYYVITDRRVTRRDRLLVFYEARAEIPMDAIQDVTYDADLWGRLFDYGDVTIRSAARAEPIKFAHAPHPEKLQALIKQRQAEATAGMRGLRHEELRKAVMSEVSQTLIVPPIGRALKEGTSPPARWRWWQRRRRSEDTRKLPPLKGTLPGPFVRLANRLPDPWRRLLIGGPAQQLQIKEGEFLWRKHPIQLIIQAGRPFLFLLIWLVFGYILFRTDLGANQVAFHLPWWLLFIFFLSWIAWEVADYGNDLYILTNDRIIDIEATPLWISIQRRESPLDRVQNVKAKQTGIWQNLLGYGDVEIQTAALDAGLTFNKVANPQLIQALIFQKLDAYKARQAERQIRERQREIVEGISIYHELRDEGHNL